MIYSVFWFKRDLRVHDHVPLPLALARGQVLCLYGIELLAKSHPEQLFTALVHRKNQQWHHV